MICYYHHYHCICFSDGFGHFVNKILKFLSEQTTTKQKFKIRIHDEKKEEFFEPHGYGFGNGFLSREI